jgi:hypothetical protein
MVAMVMTMIGLAVFAVLAARFGADSRETERTGWFVERPWPERLRGRRADAAPASCGGAASATSTRPLPQGL